MKIKNQTMFFNQDAGGPFGASGNPWEGHIPNEAPAGGEPNPSSPTPPAETPSPTVTPTHISDASQASPTLPPTGQEAVTPPVQAPPAQTDWTPERVAEIVRASREQPQQGPPQMSQEEMNRMLNAYQPSQEDVAGLLEGGEASLAALSRIVQGVVLHARTTAWYQTQYLLRQQQQQLQPVMEHYHQAEQDKLTNMFFSENKDFKPEAHMKLLAAVKTSLDAEGAFQGKSRSDGFRLIAERAKQILAASGTPLVPVASPSPNGGGKMAQLSRGAGHGSAAPAGAGSGATPNTAQRFFG